MNPSPSNSPAASSNALPKSEASDFCLLENAPFFLRIAITGAKSGGKTYTAMRLAAELAKRLGLPHAAADTCLGIIDADHQAAQRYARTFDPVRFLTLNITGEYSPVAYINAIDKAARRGIKILIVDGASQAWQGKGGALEMVDKQAALMAARATESRGGRGRQAAPNTWSAWSAVTPIQNRFVQALMEFPGHIFVLLRSHMEHVQVVGESGRSEIVRVGLAPIQREEFVYEFDSVIDMTAQGGSNFATISATRCAALRSQTWENPGPELAGVLHDYLDGVASFEAAIAAQPSMEAVAAYAVMLKSDPAVSTDLRPYLIERCAERYKALRAAKAAASAGAGAPVLQKPAAAPQRIAA